MARRVGGVSEGREGQEGEVGKVNVRYEPKFAYAALGTNVGCFACLVRKTQIWRPRHTGTAHKWTGRLARQVDKPLLAGARCAHRLECGE